MRSSARPRSFHVKPGQTRTGRSSGGHCPVDARVGYCRANVTAATDRQTSRAIWARHLGSPRIGSSMTLLVAAIAATVTAIVELTITQYLRVGDAQPHLVFVLAVVWTVAVGLDSGLVWAFVGGIALDTLSQRPLGSTAFALLDRGRSDRGDRSTAASGSARSSPSSRRALLSLALFDDPRPALLGPPPGSGPHRPAAVRCTQRRLRRGPRGALRPARRLDPRPVRPDEERAPR